MTAASTPTRRGEATRRGRIAALAVAASVAAGLVALAVWGVVTALTVTARIGQPVEHDGGSMTVLAAWTMDDPMRLMHPDDPEKFAQSGMNMMSAMMSDALPEDMKRVSVEVELFAGETAMTFPEEDITLTADGTVYHVYSSMLTDGELAPGHALSAVAIFEVPIATAVAEFRLGARTTAVAVDVAGSPAGHRPHGTDE